jgi:hypothetical protein
MSGPSVASYGRAALEERANTGPLTNAKGKQESKVKKQESKMKQKPGTAAGPE